MNQSGNKQSENIWITSLNWSGMNKWNNKNEYREMEKSVDGTWHLIWNGLALVWLRLHRCKKWNEGCGVPFFPEPGLIWFDRYIIIYLYTFGIREKWWWWWNQRRIIIKFDRNPELENHILCVLCICILYNFYIAFCIFPVNGRFTFSLRSLNWNNYSLNEKEWVIAEAESFIRVFRNSSLCRPWMHTFYLFEWKCRERVAKLWLW